MLVGSSGFPVYLRQFHFHSDLQCPFLEDFYCNLIIYWYNSALDKSMLHVIRIRKFWLKSIKKSFVIKCFEHLKCINVTENIHKNIILGMIKNYFIIL